MPLRASHSCRVLFERQLEAMGAGLAHDQAGGARLVVERLAVLDVDPDVADLRRRHRHQLPGVGRVGEDLLVAGHPGGEDRFAHGDHVRAEGATREHRAVREDEVGQWTCRCSSWWGPP